MTRSTYSRRSFLVTAAAAVGGSLSPARADPNCLDLPSPSSCSASRPAIPQRTALSFAGIELLSTLRDEARRAGRRPGLDGRRVQQAKHEARLKTHKTPGAICGHPLRKCFGFGKHLHEPCSLIL